MTTLIRLIVIALIGLLLAGCLPSTWATPAAGTPPNSAALMSTAQHAASAAQYAANSETRAALDATATVSAAVTATAAANGTAVAVAEATRMAAIADARETATASYQGTASALAFSATRVAGYGTATAIAAAADAERIEIENHEAYLANRRTWELVWNVAMLVFAVLATAVLVFLAAVFGIRVHRTSQPVADGNGNIVLSPAGVYEWTGARLAQALFPPPAQLALPAPRPETAVQQLPPINEGHVMVIGPTRSGKSTAFRALLKERTNVVVLDPHFAPGDWPGARVIGGGGDFPAIENFMHWMEQELQQRRQLRAQGQRRFPPTTVATDEMPVIANELGADAWSVWRRWLREGWKFGLFFMLSTQSDRVETLGIKGEKDVLDNCSAVLYLGAAAVKGFPDVAQPMRRPAVLVQRGGAPQPVIIPYVPAEDPDHPAFAGDTHLPAVHPQARDIIEVVHPPELVGLHTDKGFISPAQILQVRRMLAAGESGRAIEREVFGYEAGTAYYLRKAVEALLKQEAENSTPR